MEILVSQDALNGLTNYDELIAYAKEQVAPYENMVVMANDLATPKSVVARMRKVAKAASDMRIRIEKENKQKIALCVDQLKSITQIFDEAAGRLDAQVKQYTEQKKQDKRNRLKAYYEERIGECREYTSFDKIENSRWLNATFDENDAKQEIEIACETVKQNIEVIASLSGEAATRTALLDAYKRGRTVAEVAALYNDMRAAKAAEQAQTPVKQPQALPFADRLPLQAEVDRMAVAQEEEIEVCFRVRTTRVKLGDLKTFLNMSGIWYGRI